MHLIISSDKLSKFNFNEGYTVEGDFKLGK